MPAQVQLRQLAQHRRHVRRGRQAEPRVPPKGPLPDRQQRGRDGALEPVPAQVDPGQRGGELRPGRGDRPDEALVFEVDGSEARVEQGADVRGQGEAAAGEGERERGGLEGAEEEACWFGGLGVGGVDGG